MLVKRVKIAAQFILLLVVLVCMATGGAMNWFTMAVRIGVIVGAALGIYQLEGA